MPEKSQLPALPEPGEPNAEAAADVEAYVSDIFKLEGPPEKHHEPTEVERLTSELADRAMNMTGHYLGRQPSGSTVRKAWEQSGRVDLPVVKLGDSEFVCSVARAGDDSLSFTLSRPDRPNSGFTVNRLSSSANAILTIDALATQQPELTKDDLKKAKGWLNSYSKAIHVDMHTIKDKPAYDLFPSVITPQEKRLQRKARVAVMAKSIAAIGIAGIGLFGAVGYFHHRTEQQQFFDQTHSLPTDIPFAYAGDKTAVGYGESLDQEVINGVPEYNVKGKKGNMMNSSALDAHFTSLSIDEPHQIRSMPAVNLATNNCAYVDLEGIASNSGVKVVTTKQEISDSLWYHVDRAEMQICANNATKVGEREVFVEIKQPQG